MTMFGSIIFSFHFNLFAPIVLLYVQCHAGDQDHQMWGLQQAFGAQWVNIIHEIIKQERFIVGFGRLGHNRVEHKFVQHPQNICRTLGLNRKRSNLFLMVHCAPILSHKRRPSTISSFFSFLQNRWQNWQCSRASYFHNISTFLAPMYNTNSSILRPIPTTPGWCV